ncbi:MAG: YfhO family protein, partial [Oscillospiraceae bacterium]
MQKDKMLKRNLMYTLLLSAAMMLAIYAALGIMPFGDNTVLTGDLNGLYVPHYAGFHDALTSGGGLTFNLEKSLGGNMLGLFASPFSSPFFLLYLFFSPEKYGVVTTVILACKIILACLSMCVFVTKRFPTLCAHAITMSLCYGFMAYNLAYAQNEMWLDIVILLPLIALCIERILDNKSFVLF